MPPPLTVTTCDVFVNCLSLRSPIPDHVPQCEPPTEVSGRLPLQPSRPGEGAGVGSFLPGLQPVSRPQPTCCFV